MIFKNFKLSLSSLLLIFSSASTAKIPNDLETSNHWLQLLDSGKYPESWNTADTILKDQISLPSWVKAINSFRTPLGQPVSRENIMSKEFTSLPGAPDGEYLVMKFKTEFQNKKDSIETLTFNKSEKKWRVIGYYIN